MTKRADSVRVAHPLFQTEGGGSTPTSALQLQFEVTDRQTMQDLNRLWHSRLPRFKSGAPCRIYYAAEYDGVLYAVAAWSNPVSAMIDPTWLELRRLAISDDAPKNTASRMLGWMVRDIRKRFQEVPRLISYQDPAVHNGTIYRASGWTSTGKRKSGGFGSAKVRYRRPDQAPGPKVRWEKVLIVNSAILAHTEVSEMTTQDVSVPKKKKTTQLGFLD